MIYIQNETNRFLSRYIKKLFKKNNQSTSEYFKRKLKKFNNVEIDDYEDIELKELTRIIEEEVEIQELEVTFKRSEKN